MCLSQDIDVHSTRLNYPHADKGNFYKLNTYPLTFLAVCYIRLILEGFVRLAVICYLDSRGTDHIS